MADRMCSYCWQPYTDKGGHDYDECVKRCEEDVSKTTEWLRRAKRVLKRAKAIQSGTWWQEKVKAKKVKQDSTPPS